MGDRGAVGMKKFTTVTSAKGDAPARARAHTRVVVWAALPPVVIEGEEYSGTVTLRLRKKKRSQ